MFRFHFSMWWVALFAAASIAQGEVGDPIPILPPPSPAKKVSVVVIPVKEQIAAPVLYILRRGLKSPADVVVLEMNTPGGNLGTTFEILEALEKFKGETITFVDKDAISAGAFIAAATKEIYFAPNGVIGAAAPVSSEGQDVEKTMKQKIVSYLKARIRSISEGKGSYRGQVISAMIDENYELKIGDKVLKEKGELLSLTAAEASKTYGDPPQPLLAAGIAANIDELLSKKFGADGYVVERLEITWSEKLAQYLTAISPVLLGLGMLALFIEFKTPGFGFFGIAGISLLAIVFMGSYVAGLSGHEPMLFFVLGAILLVLELLFFHSAGILGLLGALLMAGSLIWSMADLWPHEPIGVAWSADAFVQPFLNFSLGLLTAAVLGLALIRFIPHGWFWDRLIVGGTVIGSAQEGGIAPGGSAQLDALMGRQGVAVTDLRPSGQVEVDGRRYEAKVEVGSIDAREGIIVRGRTAFGLVVESVLS